MNEELETQIKNSDGRKIFADYLAENFQNSGEMLEKFDKLTEMYLEVLSVTNISAIKEIDDIYIKHYLDSIYPHKYFEGACCDVGCGGGFPSIPLAIVNENKITGVESVGKKLLLLHRCVSELHLRNLGSEYARSEDLVKLHRSYDTVCCRALADTDKSVGFCAPLCKPNGKLLLYKTQNDAPAKPDTCAKHYVTLEETVDYVLPETDIKRRLFVYGK